MNEIKKPMDANVKKKFNKVLLQFQDERIQAFINACKEKFFNKMYMIRKPFMDIVCGHSITDDPKKTYISSDFDKMLKIKENADIFFSYYVDWNFILYEHYLSDWVCQSKKRVNAWESLCQIIEKYCQMHYGCRWGEQNIEYNEPIPQYLPLTWEKTKEENMVNRPLYYKDTLIGFVKKIIAVNVVVGYDKVYDDDEYEYVVFPKYKKYASSIAFYGTPNKVDGIKFYQKNDYTYILNETLSNYEVLKDRINIIKINK